MQVWIQRKLPERGHNRRIFLVEKISNWSRSYWTWVSYHPSWVAVSWLVLKGWGRRGTILREKSLDLRLISLTSLIIIFHSSLMVMRKLPKKRRKLMSRHRGTPWDSIWTRLTWESSKISKVTRQISSSSNPTLKITTWTIRTKHSQQLIQIRCYSLESEVKMSI